MKTDAEVQKNVMEELKWEPFLQSSEIGVAVKNGIVTLYGTVDSYLKKVTAEKVAKKMEGVKAVAEEIVVKYPGDLMKNDTEIALAILNALQWYSGVQDEKINIKVEDGIVSLEGEVEWEFQKNGAISQVENLVGIKKIINSIRVRNPLSVKDIKQRISTAFHRMATVNARKIDVETSESKVILKGKVCSWAERRDAEKAAWTSAGVTSVENLLEVDANVFTA